MLREEYKIKKQIIITIFCAILVFITPFTVVSQENQITKIKKDQKDMNEIVDQLQVLINKILQNYGQIPMVENLCNMILGVLETIALFVFCLVFGLFVAIPLAILMLILFFTGITNSYFGQVIFFVLFKIFFFWDYNCNFITFPVDLLFKSTIYPVSNISKTYDISNHNGNCP